MPRHKFIKTLKGMDRAEKEVYYDRFAYYKRNGLYKWDAIRLARRDVTFGMH